MNNLVVRFFIVRLHQEIKIVDTRCVALSYNKWCVWLFNRVHLPVQRIKHFVREYDLWWSPLYKSPCKKIWGPVIVYCYSVWGETGLFSIVCRGVSTNNGSFTSTLTRPESRDRATILVRRTYLKEAVATQEWKVELLRIDILFLLAQYVFLFN